MKKQKIILRGPSRAELLSQQDIPSLMPLLDIAACGICATDRKGFLAPPATMQLPLVLGHEFCGTLLSTGKRVVVWPAISCGQCSLCTQGKANLCKDIQLFGLHLDGGYQEQFSLPPALAERALFLDIPPQLSWKQACLAEPLGCVLHSLATMQQPPESARIYGAGLMGILAARAIEHRWPDCLLEVIDPDPLRQQLFVHNHRQRQVDLVFLACSDPAAVTDGLTALKPGGHMLLFSGLPRDTNPLLLDYNQIHRQEQTLHGSYGCLPADMGMALDLMARGTILVDDLIHNVVSLAQVPDTLKGTPKASEFKTIIAIQ